MHWINAKIKLVRCPLTACDGLCEPDEINVENWKCKKCGRVWFIRLVG